LARGFFLLLAGEVTMPVGCGLWSDFVEEFKIFDFFEHKLLNPIQNVKSISIKVAVGALLLDCKMHLTGTVACCALAT
jgi:hypothetical protein